jgi:hypothetical protein
VPFDPEIQIKKLLEPFRPEVRDLTLYVRRFLHSRVPGGYELVYDNHDVLVFGYGPTGEKMEVIIQLAVHPKFLDLGFRNSSAVHNLKKLREKPFARHIRITSPEKLQQRAFGILLSEAVKGFGQPETTKIQTVLKSVSAAKLRPRTIY